MSTYKGNLPILGHLDAQVVLAAGSATGAVYALPAKARKIMVVCHVGTFSGAVTKVDFTVSMASDAAGTGAAAATAFGTIASVTTEKTNAVVELDPALSDAAKPYIAIKAAVTGGTSAPVFAVIQSLDPSYSA